MKSAQRHNLQTNVVAHGLEVFIERYKPYLSKIVAGLAAIVVLLLIWSYLSSSSAARRSGSWDAFHDAVGSQPMNLEQLRQAAQENTGTKMQQLADVTWADGQVYIASNSYIYNRKAADEALNRAASAYRSVLLSSDNERLISRSRLGLARVYEMQNDLEKARKEYEQVTGAYAKYAKAQAERLAKPEAAETYAWLATAQPPRPIGPSGPGTPGMSPELFPSDIPLPGASEATPGTGEAVGAAEAFDALLKEMQKDIPANDKGGDRYKTDEPTEPPKGLLDSPATGDATKDDAKEVPKDDATADEKKAAK